MLEATVEPALSRTYDKLFHDGGVARSVLPLDLPTSADIVQGLSMVRLERAIGIVYRPETERQSHYFDAVPPRLFDEYIWFDQTHVVRPIKIEEIEGCRIPIRSA